MTKLNPLIEAIGEIDDALVEKAQAPSKKRARIRTLIIAAAAVLALGTTAAGATFGNNPIVKINNKRVSSRYSSYVNEDGWTIETTAVELPVNYCRYQPVGEIRATFDSDTQDVVCYDELGVRLDRKVHHWVNLYVHAEKDGETPFLFVSGSADGDHHQGETMSADGKEIEIDFWQDPAQALKSEFKDKKFKRQTAEERYADFLIYGDPFEYAELDGFKCPTYHELFAIEDIRITNQAATFPSMLPNEAMKMYDYAPVELKGFSEKAGLSVFFFTDEVRWENGLYVEEHEITQQMFIYTLVEEQSGAEVLFTVWRSAENKDTYTDHFDFDYEYIPLNNGSNARIHQGLDDIFILEFEKDGAAYGLKFDGERDFAETILERMGLL